MSHSNIYWQIENFWNRKKLSSHISYMSNVIYSTYQEYHRQNRYGIKMGELDIHKLILENDAFGFLETIKGKHYAV